MLILSELSLVSWTLGIKRTNVHKALIANARGGIVSERGEDDMAAGVTATIRQHPQQFAESVDYVDTLPVQNVDNKWLSILSMH